MKLTGKTAIITGGGGFVGRAIATRLGAEGANIALIDANDAAAETVRANLASTGVAASAHECDICDPKIVNKTIQHIIEKHGKIDVLVNCAGGGARKESRPFHEQSLGVIENILRINLMGTIYCAHAVAPFMVKAGYGKIINISSIIGEHGLANYGEYAAAKGGIIALTRSLAMDLGKYNINANCVSPGIVNRDPIPDEKEFAHRTTYLNRACTGADVAAVVCFLASSESDFVTGQNYIVDGGRSLGLKGS